MLLDHSSWGEYRVIAKGVVRGYVLRWKGQLKDLDIVCEPAFGRIMKWLAACVLLELNVAAKLEVLVTKLLQGLFEVGTEKKWDP